MNERLAKYQEMRDFSRTAEPSGAGLSEATGNRFVVQRHRARRRHYDLRLELDGVLVSWAVPKGPTLDPKARRMAVHVEDHPLEYAAFEGVIPAGQYGGGDVIVWDHGTWAPAETDDPARALDDGNLHFDLFGEKLAGRFVLVRTGRDDTGKQWLLLHKNDDHAQPGWDAEDHPKSVQTGRTNEEVAAEPDALWRSDLPAAEAEQRLDQDDPPAALDTARDGDQWRIGGYPITLTGLDTAPPSTGVPRRALIRYTAQLAAVLLRYLPAQPVPDDAPSWFPRRWQGPVTGAALVWLAATDRLPTHANQPGWAVFGIEPGEQGTFGDVLTLARLHGTALHHLGLAGRPVLTGPGVQVWVPIARGQRPKTWLRTVAKTIAATVPDLTAPAKNVLGAAKSPVVPYTVLPGGTVAVPLEWSELDDVRPDQWTIDTVPDRIDHTGDPLDAISDAAQHLPDIT